MPDTTDPAIRLIPNLGPAAIAAHVADTDPHGDRAYANSLLTSAYSAQNKDSVTLGPGAPVSADVSGSGVVAASAASTAKPCAGFAKLSIAPTFAGTVVTTGTLTLSDWSGITGSSTLTRGPYFLSTTSGQLTATPPSVAGQILQCVGYAIASDTLEINIQPPIRL